MKIPHFGVIKQYTDKLLVSVNTTGHNVNIHVLEL